MDDDANNTRAVATYDEIDSPICTSTHVLAETMSLLTKRVSKQHAIRAGRRILRSPRTVVLRPTAADLRVAWREFADRPDWDCDLVDAISSALMRRERSDAALTFDHHFAQMGFITLPD